MKHFIHRHHVKNKQKIKWNTIGELMRFLIIFCDTSVHINTYNSCFVAIYLQTTFFGEQYKTLQGIILSAFSLWDQSEFIKSTRSYRDAITLQVVSHFPVEAYHRDKLLVCSGKLWYHPLN